MNEAVDVELVMESNNLNVRRTLERQLLYSADEMISDTYYLISDSWLIAWKDFLVGGDLPGPINNAEPSTYRAVNKSVWNLLIRLYGGGPEL